MLALEWLHTARFGSDTNARLSNSRLQSDIRYLIGVCAYARAVAVASMHMHGCIDGDMHIYRDEMVKFKISYVATESINVNTVSRLHLY